MNVRSALNGIVAVSGLLITTVSADTVVDVKNYAVIASSNFVNHSDELKELIIRTILDVKEDMDIRHDTYSAVRAFFDLPGRKAVLEKLSSDKELGKAALRDLEELLGSTEE